MKTPPTRKADTAASKARSKPMSLVISKAATPKTLTVKLGNVEVKVASPSLQQVRQRIAAGKKAASALSKVAAKPGVRLNLPTSTPVYTADPDNPEFVILKLRGSKVRGRFKNGKFVEA